MTAKSPTKDSQHDREHRQSKRHELVGATTHDVDDQGGQPQPKNHVGGKVSVLLQHCGCSEWLTRPPLCVGDLTLRPYTTTSE